MSGRNFGIPKVTSPAAGGGTQLPGSHSPHDTQRGNVIQLADHYPPGRRLNSGLLKSAPPLIPDEDMEAAAFAFAAMWGSPYIILGIGLIVYSLFIA